jgi:hypothetical protein
MAVAGTLRISQCARARKPVQRSAGLLKRDEEPVMSEVAADISKEERRIVIFDAGYYSIDVL